MDPLHPAGPEFVLERPPGELEPRPVEKVGLVVPVGTPHHDRRRIGHQPEAAFAFAQIPLDAQAARPLQQEAADQHRLQDQQCRGREDVILVLRPETRLPVEHRGARRQAALIEPPPSQLPPVELDDVQVYSGDRNRGRVLTRQHSQRDRTDLVGQPFRAQEAATHDPVIHRHRMPAVNRRIRYGGDFVQRIHRNELAAGAVLGE